MNILLTNDDGIHSPAMKELYEACLRRGWNPVIVAPSEEKSGAGHSITIFQKLTVEEIYQEEEFFGYAFSGTPADCVKFAINEICSEYPDIVISGINRGFNLGCNILYSGTVSAAMEASFMNIPAIASSTGHDFSIVDLKELCEQTLDLAAWRIEKNVPARFMLNMNIPDIPSKEIKGLKYTRQGKLYYEDSFTFIETVENKKVVANEGSSIQDPEKSLETDSFAVKSGYISVTPLHFDLTAYESLENLQK